MPWNNQTTPSANRMMPPKRSAYVSFDLARCVRVRDAWRRIRQALYQGARSLRSARRERIGGMVGQGADIT